MFILLAAFFGLPLVQIVVWSVMLAVSRSSVKIRWPYIASLAVAMVLIIGAVALYVEPRSMVAYEGDEADPRGINMMILGFNGVCVLGITLALWGISMALPRPQVPVVNHDQFRPPVI